MHKLVWTALLAALTGVGAYLEFPIGPVPFSMQTFFVLLTGFVLGPGQAALCMLLYIAAGTIGLPVFVKGGSGFAHLMGPTGGYLAGFLAAAVICGLAVRKNRDLSWMRGIVFGIAAVAALYALGVLRLMSALDIDPAKALAVGVVPFLPGSALKLAAAVACCRYLRKRRLLPF